MVGLAKMFGSYKSFLNNLVNSLEIDGLVHLVSSDIGYRQLAVFSPEWEKMLSEERRSKISDRSHYPHVEHVNYKEDKIQYKDGKVPKILTVYPPINLVVPVSPEDPEPIIGSEIEKYDEDGRHIILDEREFTHENLKRRLAEEIKTLAKCNREGVNAFYAGDLILQFLIPNDIQASTQVCAPISGYDSFLDRKASEILQQRWTLDVLLFRIKR